MVLSQKIAPNKLRVMTDKHILSSGNSKWPPEPAYAQYMYAT
jgi:hypothetical protein